MSRISQNSEFLLQSDKISLILREFGPNCDPNKVRLVRSLANRPLFHLSTFPPFHLRWRLLPEDLRDRLGVRARVRTLADHALDESANDLLEEVASVANAQLREPPLIPAVEVVGDARALEQSRERLSQVDGGRREGRERRQAAGGTAFWKKNYSLAKRRSQKEF